MDIQTANLLLLIGLPLLAFVGVLFLGHVDKKVVRKVKAMPKFESDIDIDDDVVGDGYVDPNVVFREDGIHMYD
ncbi:hypothetical protein [Alcanivorax sediminis]|uniref:Uncharacterized protein n=1 Tax=Alcanivorax sediminis TaxID=2663008 RepID=A0A6N7LPS0_9GAMM|nr:hypothetical protein [Alcanivorax sediminis]MQX52209.1 hypothetical protein [Alcanivorax sediminis]